MALQRLHTLTARNDDTDAFVLDFIPDDLRDLGHVLWQWYHYPQMFLWHAKPAADGFELIGSSAVLPSGHTGCKVVADDDHDVCIFVDRVPSCPSA